MSPRLVSASASVRVLGTLLAILTVVGSGLLAAPAADAATSGRVSGPDRYATAAAIAARSFVDAAPTVYLARGDVFSDALVAGVLTDGPVLLVPPCGPVPSPVADQIARLDPAEVVALGGTSAVCDPTLAAAAKGRPTERLQGATRYDTAVAVARRAFPSEAETVYLANGADSPDAVAGGALTDGPILLIPPSGSVSPELREAIEVFDPEQVVALGGTAAVTEAGLADAAGGRPTGRVAGPDRYATAAAIARRAFPADAAVPAVYIARGSVFADAVAAGSLADGPVLLVATDGELPAGAADYLGAVTTDRVIALGGENAVSDAVLAAAAALPRPAPPPPAPPRPPTASGMLYYGWNSTMTSYDFATRFETSLADNLAATYHVSPEFDEFVWSETTMDDEEAIEVLDLATGAVNDLVSLPFKLRQTPHFVPDSSLLAGLAYHLTDGGSIEYSRRDVVFFDRQGQLRDLAISKVKAYTFTPDGDVVAALELGDGTAALTEFSSEVYAGGDPAAVDVRVLREFPNYDNLPTGLDVSPDGTQVVYTYLEHLYRLPMDGSRDHLQLTTSNFQEAGAHFSPDGNFIVFSFEELATSSPIGRVTIIPNHDADTPIRVSPGGSTNPADPWHPFPLQPVDDQGDALATDSAGVYWGP